MCQTIMSLIMGGIGILVAIILVIMNFRKIKLVEWVVIVLLFSIAFSVHGLVHINSGVGMKHKKCKCKMDM